MSLKRKIGTANDPESVERSAQADCASNAYGWVMVVVAALAMVATLPGRTHGLGMITERLLADPSLNLSRTGYGQINLWATLIGSLFCFGIGSAIDRFGVKWTLALVMTLLGAVVVGMSRVTTIPLLFVTMLLTRGLGQSALSVVSITIVGKWFDRNISFPMAVYAVLLACGFIAAALIGRQYSGIDWRTVWGVMGAIVLVSAFVLTLVSRDHTTRSTGVELAPEQLHESKTSRGNAVTDDATVTVAQSIVPSDYTYQQAIRTPMFWVCAFGISLYGMIVSGISLFNESILVDQGFRHEVYYESLAWGTGIGMISKLFAGWLGLRLSVNYLLSGALVLLAASLIWLTQLTTYQDVMVYVAMSAIAGGTLTVLFFSAWPDLYGRSHLGRIQGSAQMMTVTASAFGPLVFAQSKEWTGSYHFLIRMLAAAVVVTALVAWWTPLPSKISTVDT